MNLGLQMVEIERVCESRVIEGCNDAGVVGIPGPTTLAKAAFGRYQLMMRRPLAIR